MKQDRRRIFSIIIGGFAIFLAALLFLVFAPGSLASTGELQTTPVSPIPQPTPNPNLSIPNEYCLGCHGQSSTVMELKNGDILHLFVPEEVYGASIHGESGIACVQCHRNVGEYPHPPFNAQDLRDVSLQLYQACKYCHANEFELTQDSVHAAALAAGNRNAAICTDCHTAHAVQQITYPESQKVLPEARQWIPQTCAKCHYAIFQKYSTSVHGAAVLQENNLDVPTCIDCHGVHNIENPTTAEFRLKSPELCAKCHTDPAIMDKYGISTQVLQTYVADFHGTTVTLFEKESPDQQTNKPVCYDCHGVHDIKRIDDPKEGLQIKQNLLKRCQQCHPDATINFPDAWLSHYIPSTEHHPLVYSVNLFYMIFIPTVLGGMGILVFMDAGASLFKRYRRRKKIKPGARVYPVPELEAQANPGSKGQTEAETSNQEARPTWADTFTWKTDEEVTEPESAPGRSELPGRSEPKVDKDLGKERLSRGNQPEDNGDEAGKDVENG